MELSITKVPGQEDNASMQSVQVNEAIFGYEFKEDLIHQVVTAFLAGARQGSKAQKTRSEVNGGGKKPWKQKGSGRARAGTSRSPIWRKGGVTFAAKPKSYAQKVNKKMYRGAMCSILAELGRQNRFFVVEKFDMATPKTKELLTKVQGLGVDDVLIITENVEGNLYLASRNLYKVAVCDVAGINPVALVGFANIIITAPALAQLEEKLA